MLITLHNHHYGCLVTWESQDVMQILVRRRQCHSLAPAQIQTNTGPLDTAAGCGCEQGATLVPVAALVTCALPLLYLTLAQCTLV